MARENVMELQQNDCLLRKLGKITPYPLLPALLLLPLLSEHDHQCLASKDPTKVNLQAFLHLRHHHPVLLHNKL
jgi:hypothetical protein